MTEFERYADEFIQAQADLITKNTARAYKLDIVQFLQFIEKNGLALNANALNAYYYFLCTHYTASSVNRKLMVVRRFMQFLHQKKNLIDDPPRVKSVVFTQVDTQRVLKKEVIQALIYGILPAQFTDVRDRAILALTYDAALRVSEVVKMKVEDVDLESRTIVRFPNDRWQIEPDTAKRLAEYLRYRNTVFVDTPANFFLNAKGKALSPQSVWLIFSNRSRAILGYPVVPSMIRMSRLYHLLEETCDGELIARAMRFMGKSSTYIYRRRLQEKITSLSVHPSES